MATHFYISQAYFGQFSQLTLGHRHSKTHLKFYFYFHILSLKIPLAANSLVLAHKIVINDCGTYKDQIIKQRNKTHTENNILIKYMFVAVAF